MRSQSRKGILALLLAGGLMTHLGGAMAADYGIVIDKMTFGAVPTELHVGDTIIWQNNDIFRHTSTARDKSFDVDLPAKSATRMELKAAGRFAFFCKFHPGMKDMLVVYP